MHAHHTCICIYVVYTYVGVGVNPDPDICRYGVYVCMCCMYVCLSNLTDLVACLLLTHIWFVATYCRYVLCVRTYVGMVCMYVLSVLYVIRIY